MAFQLTHFSAKASFVFVFPNEKDRLREVENET